MSCYKEKLLNLKEVQDLLNIKESKLRSMIFKKEIPYLKVGRLIRFNKEVIDDWLTSLEIN